MDLLEYTIPDEVAQLERWSQDRGDLQLEIRLWRGLQTSSMYKFKFQSFSYRCYYCCYCCRCCCHCFGWQYLPQGPFFRDSCGMGRARFGLNLAVFIIVYFNVAYNPHCNTVTVTQKHSNTVTIFKWDYIKSLTFKYIQIKTIVILDKPFLKYRLGVG